MLKPGTWFSTQVDLSFWRRLNECLESYAWRFEDMYVWCLLKKGTLRNNITLMSSHLENCLFIFVQLIVCKNNIWIDLELMSMWQCNLLLCWDSSCLLCYLDSILMLRVPMWIFFLLMETEYWPGLNDGGCKLNGRLAIRKMHCDSASSLSFQLKG